MNRRQEKMESVLGAAAASYFNLNSNRSSLITVTRCDISPDNRKGTIYVTIFPDDKEEEALAFARRRRPELREYIGKQLNSKVLPYLDIELDVQEKARQIEDRA
jgi:ribosome-binding factor A